jgi:hypothetical protein
MFWCYAEDIIRPSKKSIDLYREIGTHQTALIIAAGGATSRFRSAHTSWDLAKVMGLHH